MNIKKMIKLKGILLLCLVWVCVFAVPVQSQTATPAPTPINCDAANTLTDGTTYELTADCAGASTTITVAAGVTATLNGNGYTISGATGNPVITVGGANAQLTLNDIAISGSGVAGEIVFRVQQGATLIAENVIFSGNVGTPLRVGDADTTAELTNVQFLNNAIVNTAGEAASALLVHGSATTSATITGATFSGNSGTPQVIRVNVGSVTLTGCIRASGNTNADGDPAEFATGRSGTTIIGGPGGCPRPQKKKKDDPTPAPTATERPPTPATCMGLHAATGIVVNAAFGLNSGIQCQQLDGGGIGIQALAANYIAAVDIWGYVDQGVEVCFPGVGRIIFLDASTMPRAMALLPTHGAENGITCASIESPGSLVLLPPE